MTTRKTRPGAGGPAGSAEVVSIAGRLGYKRMACAQFARARAQAGMTRPELAAYLTSELGWDVTREAVEYWEEQDGPSLEVMYAVLAAAGSLPAVSAPLLDGVPHNFPAGALAGHWVTAYQFTHAGKPMFHVDIAVVTAESERLVRAVNHPPEPRTQGRAYGFRNVIEAELAGRHLLGQWRNVSDTRYFGGVHLAVLPGEAAMEGTYSGLASDIAVSGGPWKWVRINPESLPGEDLSRVVLREPLAVYETVTAHSGDNGPLELADIGEEH
jgi:hypothetical protein